MSRTVGTGERNLDTKGRVWIPRKRSPEKKRKNEMKPNAGRTPSMRGRWPRLDREGLMSRHAAIARKHEIGRC